MLSNINKINMKKYISGAVLVFALLFTPLAMVQADFMSQTKTGALGEMTEMMDSMMAGEMSPEQQMEFSNKMQNRIGYSHFGKFGSKVNYSGATKVLLFFAYTVKAAFGLFTLTLLVMLNILLYRKLQRKKKK